MMSDTLNICAMFDFQVTNIVLSSQKLLVPALFVRRCFVLLSCFDQPKIAVPHIQSYSSEIQSRNPS